MAFPANLYRVDVSGVYRDPTDPGGPDLFEWALIWWVLTGRVLVAPDEYDKAGSTYVTLLQNPGVLEGNRPIASGTVVTRWGAYNPATDTEVHVEGEVDIGAGIAKGVVPPQVALMVFARSQDLGKQTRKWLPCIRRDMLEPEAPRWSDVMPAGGNLFDWAKQFLAPTEIFGTGIPGVQMVPIIWDADNESVHEIIDVKASEWPRTQRRRVLSAARNYI